MLYDVLNVKTTHGIDFQSFFELMKIASDDMEEDTSGNNDFILLSVLDFFCVNIIIGFNKLSLILDWILLLIILFMMVECLFYIIIYI